MQTDAQQVAALNSIIVQLNDEIKKRIMYFRSSVYSLVLAYFFEGDTVRRVKTLPLLVWEFFLGIFFPAKIKKFDDK